MADDAGRLRALSHRLVEIQEQERRDIARELHDEIGQVLTGLSVAVEMTRREVDGAPAERLEAAQEMVRELFGRVRELSLDLRPVMLDDLGLLPALRALFDRFTRSTRVRSLSFVLSCISSFFSSCFSSFFSSPMSMPTWWRRIRRI
jgi:signal transduction histidine kinase